MRTTEEIKRAMACPVCEQGEQLECSECVYHGRELPPCLPAMHEDAIACIQRLEAERDALLNIARHFAGCFQCKHEPTNPEYQPCKGCGILNNNWEWRGAPDKEG